MTQRSEQVHDEWLVLRSQCGEEAALCELVARWSDRLRRHAAVRCADEDAAMDILQETWIAIVRRLPRLDDPAAFPAWAHRILMNKCADWVRSRKRDRAQIQHASERATAHSSDSSPSRDDLDELRAAIRSLPPDTRSILHLKYAEELDVASIATAMAIPTGTVKSRLHAARNQLRELLERTQQ